MVDVPIIETVEIDGEEAGEVQGYVLPPRTTRGVPPKMYDPNYEAKRSRYPIETPREGNMSQSALEFNATIYGTKLPNNIEEALENDNWRKAMEEEISALQKNGAWEKCILSEKKKVVGCKWVFTVKYKAYGTIE